MQIPTRPQLPDTQRKPTFLTVPAILSSRGSFATLVPDQRRGV
jgi:hypothetical protein